MRVLSLFDGISCGRLALQRAGVNVTEYVASEINHSAIQISKNNFSDIRHVGDVRLLDFNEGRFDLIIAGSPCQGFSNAGGKLNFDDPRSKLYFEFLRILQKVKPKKFLLENVPMDYYCEKVITKHLWVKPIVVNSSLVSAQNRVRLYWTNIPTSPIQDKNIKLSDILQTEYDDLKPYKMNKTPSRDLMWYGGKCPNITLRQKSNCLTTKQDRWANAGLLAFEDYARYLTPTECERLQTLPDNYTAGASKAERYAAIGNGWTVDVIAEIFKNLAKRTCIA